MAAPKTSTDPDIWVKVAYNPLNLGRRFSVDSTILSGKDEGIPGEIVKLKREREREEEEEKEEKNKTNLLNLEIE